MKRSGFTLIEVIVAMTIAAIAAQLCLGIFRAVSDGIAHANNSLQVEEGRVNAWRWMSDVFGAVEPVGQQESGFAGSEQSMEFVGGIRDATGEEVSSLIDLSFEDDMLIARSSVDSATVLARGLAWGRFEYVVAYGATAPLHNVWNSRISAPLAIRVVMAHVDGAISPVDTLLFWVGTRL